MDALLIIFLLLSLAVTGVLLYQMLQMRRSYGPLDDLQANIQKLITKKQAVEIDVKRSQSELSGLGNEIQQKQLQLTEQIKQGQLQLAVQIKQAQHELAEQTREIQLQLATQIQKSQYELAAQTLEARDEFAVISKELAKVDGEKSVIDCGLYKPSYNFDKSENYKLALDKIYDVQAEYIKNGHAAKCAAHWTVGGSEKEGANMARQTQKLMLRAFNGECDSAIARVAWNNVARMEERINKAHHIANELGKTMQIEITPEYLDSKLEELRLTFEYEEKKHQEKEEQKRIREQMKEDEKAHREIERSRQEAEDEEKRYEKALAKATEEAKTATGAKLTLLNNMVEELQKQVIEAQNKKQKAVSMAQLTRAGYVYIISNIGSFGDTVYKVGMTRRLDPNDRIDELGNASVPFPFDVHAMVYSDDAPELENSLHQLLHKNRVNLVNHHKEFFLADLKEIAKHVKAKGHELELTLAAEAQEYRKTQAIRTATSSALAS